MLSSHYRLCLSSISQFSSWLPVGQLDYLQKCVIHIIFKKYQNALELAKLVTLLIEKQPKRPKYARLFAPILTISFISVAKLK